MSAAAQTTNINAGDKITLAVLSHQIIELTALQKEQHKEVVDKIDGICKDVHVLDNEQCIQGEKIAGIVKDIDENIKPDVKQLRSRDTWWSSINSIAIAIATILGIRN